MRILWHSNAPWVNSGYGTQTNTFVWRLKALGHEVAVSCFFGLQGKPITIDGVTVLPAGREQYGNDLLAAHAKYWGADIVITLADAWVFEPHVTQQFQWYPWLPVDTDPIAPDVERALQTAVQPIAYSRYGEMKLREIGFEPLYVPHGIDTQVFSPANQTEARAKLGWPEKMFIVGIVSANHGYPSRKAFDQQIRAFAEFHRNHPDSLLYLHTDMTEIGRQKGENIDRLIEMAGLPRSAVIQVDPYRYAVGLISSSEMAQIYSAMDVLLNASRGGGFELPILEAQACSTPVITTNFSAMPELVSGGWAVDYIDKFFYQNSYQVIPSVESIIAALEAAYQAKQTDQLAALREQARSGALPYDADHVVEQYWKPVLQLIENRVRRDDKRQELIEVRAA